MYKTNSNNNACIDGIPVIAVKTEQLQLLLNCGRDTAIAIGNAAKAKFPWPNKDLWSVDKVRDYVIERSYDEKT